MFKFWYKNLLMPLFFALAFVAFLGVFVYAALTDRMTQIPEDNQAPFIETRLDQNGNRIDNVVALNVPHKTDKELQRWITAAISEALTFGMNDFSQVQAAIRPRFSSRGYEKYAEYLKDSNVLRSLKQNNYRIGIFVESNPIQISAQEIQGFYNWFYEVPVTLSFMPESMPGGYTNNDYSNRKLKIRVQLRRERIGDDPYAMLIEHWDVQSRQ